MASGGCVVNEPFSNTSRCWGAARLKQSLQRSGDAGWQQQFVDLRHRALDRVSDLAECHLTVLPDGVRGLRPSILGLPETARIDHRSSIECLGERKMRVADEEDVGVDGRAFLTP